MKVKVIYERIQDGQKEISEYEGQYEKLNNSENISFSEDETGIEHLLEVTEELMRWTRNINISNRVISSDLEFGTGRVDNTEYVTPHGNISMEVSTEKYQLARHEESGMPLVELEYVIRHLGEVVSEYAVVIRVV